jgi:hypothetical protein
LQIEERVGDPPVQRSSRDDEHSQRTGAAPLTGYRLREAKYNSGGGRGLKEAVALFSPTV